MYAPPLAEEENTAHRGEMFSTMLARYQQGRPPVQVVFLSFIGQAAPGQMATELKQRGIPYRQFRLNRERPDLTRLDEFLGHLSLGGPMFHERLATVTTWAASEPLVTLAQRASELVRTRGEVSEPAAAPLALIADAPPIGFWGRVVRRFFGN